jgi:hypothetical protein
VIPRSLAHRETDIAEALLPGARLDGATVVRSGSHDVVLLPDVAAIRIARNPPAVAALPRRTALLTELAKAGLPFATPTPLGPVSSTPAWTAVAVSWIPGHPAPSGTGDPSLEPGPPRLVHGDLTGGNMHWSVEARVLGVLDWDLAHPYDPAIDVACLAHWHGWPTIGRTVDAATYARARTWYGTFALEQIVKTLLDGADDSTLSACVEQVVRWMDGDGCD